MTERSGSGLKGSPSTTCAEVWSQTVHFLSSTLDEQKGNMKFANSMEEFECELKAAGDKLVVVDFTASWCGPCRAIAPVFEELAAKEANVVFFKVDVDEAEDVTKKYEISSMPTFIFIKNGNEVGRFSGASKDKLVETVNKLK